MPKRLAVKAMRAVSEGFLMLIGMAERQVKEDTFDGF